MRDHDTIVDAEPLIRRVHAPPPLLSHSTHHLLEPFIATNTAHHHHLVAADMSHSALRDLDQHSVDGLLEAKAQILRRDPILLLNHLPSPLLALLLRSHLRRQQLRRRQDPAEAAVHALDRVGDIDQLPGLAPLPRQQLDVVPGGRVVADGQRAREPIQAVADGDVQRLAEDAVPPLRVGDDLRVAAADVQDDGVRGPRDLPPHLDMAHAVVDAHERQAPEQRQRPRRHRHRLQRRAHPGALRVADAA